MRPCAFPFSSGPTSTSILCVEWLCTQERYNPELAIVFGAAARYAGLQLAAAMMMRIRIIKRCTRGRFAPTLGLWGAFSSYRPVRDMAVRKCSKCCQLFRAFRGRAFFARRVMRSYRPIAWTFLDRPVSLPNTTSPGSGSRMPIALDLGHSGASFKAPSVVPKRFNLGLFDLRQTFSSRAKSDLRTPF